MKRSRILLKKAAFFVVIVVCVTLSIGVASAALGDNLIMFYPMNNTNAKGTDYPLTQGGAAFIAGGVIFNTADVDTDTFNTADNANISGNNDFTISGWFKNDDTTANAAYFHKSKEDATGDTSGAEIRLLYLTSSGNFQYGVGDGSGWQGAAVASGISQDTWYLITLTYDGSNIVLYRDATLIGNTSASITRPNTNGPIYWGLRSRTSTDLPYNGKIDQLGFWQRAIKKSEVTDLYNSGSGRTYAYIRDATDPAPPAPANDTFLLTASDEYTGTSLNNFSALINGTTYSTTNGTIVTPINNTRIYTVNVTVTSNVSGGYFNRTYRNHNTSSTLAAQLHQAEIGFTAANRVTGAAVTDFTASTNNNGGSDTNTDTTPRLNLSAGTYDINFTKTGYYDNTLKNVVVAALTNTTYATPIPVYDHKLNLTLTVAGGSASNQTFNVTVRDRDGNSFGETAKTQSGFIVLNLTDGNYTVWLNDSIHELKAYNITLSTGNLTSYRMIAYTTNTLLFTFLDETTNNILNGTNVTAYVTGGLQSYNFTTSNGTYTLEMIVPQSYTITYSASGYAQREYVFTLTNKSSELLRLYLLPTTAETLVTVTVTDTLGRSQASNTVSAQRKNLSGTNYYTVEECTTNNEGECTLHLIQYNITYRFRVEDSTGTAQIFSSTGTTISADTKITGSTVTLRVQIVQDTIEEILQEFDVTGSVTYSTANDRFTYTWDDNNNLGVTACLKVERTKNSITVTDSNTCQTASTGTLTTDINESTGDRFTATGYVTIGGNTYVLDTESVNTGTLAASFGTVGLFIFGFFIILSSALAGLAHPVLGPLIVLVLTLGLFWIGAISLGATAIGGLVVIVTVIAYLTRQ